MDILLDTHVFIWWDADDPALGREARQSIADSANMVFVSAASVWEIAIKRQLGKLRFDGALSDAIVSNGFTPLPITADDAEQAGALAWDHRDPFDRMIVAQCLRYRLVLATADSIIQKGPEVPVLRAG